MGKLRVTKRSRGVEDEAASPEVRRHDLLLHPLYALAVMTGSHATSSKADHTLSHAEEGQAHKYKTCRGRAMLHFL